MSASGGGVLQIGARIRFDGAAWTVAGLSGTLVRLAGQDGQPSVVQLAHLHVCGNRHRAVLRDALEQARGLS